MKQDNPCDAQQCRCGSSLPRRDFLKLSATASAGSLVGVQALSVMAGPFENVNEYLRVISTDKRLDPQWVASLFARGEKETYSDPEALRHIGMPVGGLFAGTVYLSGDGRLWLWDIFNRDQLGIVPRTIQYQGKPVVTQQGVNYIQPAPSESPFELGFSLRTDGVTRSLDLDGFSEVTFDGRYPLGRVAYREQGLPLEVDLEAFSPFIPLHVEDSSLPATILRYQVKNTGSRPIEFKLLGRIQNAICLETQHQVAGSLRNRVLQTTTGKAPLTAIECLAETTGEKPESLRPDILFEDFEKPTYAGWTVAGTAFGDGPIRIQDIPAYQGDVHGQGERVVNSHASAPAKQVDEKDRHVGTLTSKPFVVQRRFIRFLIGGGAFQGQTGLQLLIDGQVVASTTGENNNRMRLFNFQVQKYEGRQAQIQIIDHARQGWGNIGVDEIIFTDRPLESGALEQQRDFGTMTLALLHATGADHATADRAAAKRSADASKELGEPLVGELGRTVQLAPGQSADVVFLVAWHFPNFRGKGVENRRVGHAYASRFENAADVARYVAEHFDRLADATRLWVNTWYDSTLPFWFLDRTMANTSTLATTTCYRFEDGRFWAWEGIGCCPGTCTHVWHYAQALGRLFPRVERRQREQVDFGFAQHEDGGIGMRAGLTRANKPADDGQCGRILGAYREHQMSTDGDFLKRIWPRVKKAIQYMIHKDGNADGMVEVSQPNTLDAAWFGKVSFLASLYLATLKAGEAMAIEVGDAQFAETCKTIAARGAQSILETFDGEYFAQIEDPAHRDAIGIGPGCYIDQVFGQTWAHWVGLGRLFDRDKQLSALRALWNYNFVPDVGPFRKAFPRGRWYALAGDAGLVMCTWPRGGQNPNFKKYGGVYGYFNECMSGFEWQAAAHMIAEGIDQPDLLQHGLAVSRAIHDRYHAQLRNPYNEIECSDHYSRAMASYGAFLAACGYEYHGPRGHLGFTPRLTPEAFRCAFTTAEGWGSYHQQRDGKQQRHTIALKWGRLRLRSLAFSVPADAKPASVAVTVSGESTPAKFEVADGRMTLSLASDTILAADQSLEIVIS